ncbi:MAG: Gfo/Idh/MocA family oxidoreductase [Cyanobacteria bacterium J06638_6]
MVGPNSTGNVLRVGLVGTGFVARLRAEALRSIPQARLSVVAGRTVAEATAFAQQYGAISVDSWQALIAHPELDVVVVCHINCDHDAVVAAALAAHHHVVVEYPLSLQPETAQALLAQAEAQQRLLHVEHIELLSGNHQALKANLDALGPPVFARYCTLSPRHPAPKKWTYCPELFGFPLVGALARLHRLIDCFGPVARVYCQNHYNGLTSELDGVTRYTTCLCIAQLTFATGLMAEVVYGKGEALWEPARRLELFGHAGAISFDGGEGRMTNAEGTHAIAVGSRRGLFAKDMAQVIDHLLTGQPLYCQPQASLYTLRVAKAAERSAATGQAVEILAP